MFAGVFATVLAGLQSDREHVVESESVNAKAAARTFETVVDAVGEALLAVSTTDCQGYFSHCGYEATST